MLRIIVACGVIAGLIVVTPFVLYIFHMGPLHNDSGSTTGLLIGFAVQFLALSLVFVGIKRHRDKNLGGVIRFWPALACGLGISLVASLFYVFGWELTMMATNFAFADNFAQASIEAARARGASAAELARVTQEMADFKANYANPLFRIPMTFVEILPTGLLVSLVAAGLLRNPRFLPAKAPIASAAA